MSEKTESQTNLDIATEAPEQASGFRWRDRLETVAMNSFGKVMERASWGACRYTGAWLGSLFFNAARRRREIAIGNVRRAFPSMSEAAARRIARRAAQNFGMTLCEFLHLPGATPEEIRSYVELQGLENILGGLHEGRGALLLTAHFGNWELMGARMAQEFPLTVIARPSSNTGLHGYILDVRKSAGMDVISKYANARASLTALRQNRVLGILPDQHAGGEGMVLPLFGQPTRFITSLARLAMLSKSPMYSNFSVRRTPWLADGRLVARFSPCLPIYQGEKYASRDEAVRVGTQLVACEIEKAVRQHPDLWLWMHRRWRESDASPDVAMTA